MVVSKTGFFDTKLQERANLFKVLAHPARLQILQYLIQTKTCITGDISDRFPLTRATVNQHMKELKKAGLICGHQEGAKNIYCIDLEKLKQMRHILDALQEEIKLPDDFTCSL